MKQTEAAPEQYPAADVTLSEAALGLDADMVWQRIEAYTVHRWTPRAVVWVVEGPGEWVPPLSPAAIDAVEVWSKGAEAWEAASLSPSPLGGYHLPASGPYRFTGIVGEPPSPLPDLPANVREAFRRLAEYMAAKPGKPGAMSESVTAGSVSLSHRRSASWMAEAMQNSGAADLLRRYRTV